MAEVVAKANIARQIPRAAMLVQRAIRSGAQRNGFPGIKGPVGYAPLAKSNAGLRQLHIRHEGERICPPLSRWLDALARLAHAIQCIRPPRNADR
jgi:hypothetical protein